MPPLQKQRHMLLHLIPLLYKSQKNIEKVQLICWAFFTSSIQNKTIRRNLTSYEIDTKTI